jgi:hypothetical protein
VERDAAGAATTQSAPIDGQARRREALLLLVALATVPAIHAIASPHGAFAALYVPLLAVLSNTCILYIAALHALGLAGLLVIPRFPIGAVVLGVQFVGMGFMALQGRLSRPAGVVSPADRVRSFVQTRARVPMLAAAGGLLIAALFRRAPAIECLIWSATCAVTAFSLERGQAAGRRLTRLDFALAAASALVAVAIIEFGARLLLPTIPEPPGTLMADDELIFTLRPNSRSTIHVVDNARNVIEVPLSISSQGLRNPELGPKQPGEFRILLLGDSYTMGHGLTEDQTIARALESLLPDSDERRFTVINAGAGGYAPWQERIFLSRRGFPLEPDAVVVQVYPGNDVAGELIPYNKHLPAIEVAWERQLGLLRRQNEWPARWERWLQTQSNAYAHALRTFGRPGLFEPLIHELRFMPPAATVPMPQVDRVPFLEPCLDPWYPELIEAWGLFRATVAGIRDDCRARGIDLLGYCVTAPPTVFGGAWEELDPNDPGSRYEPNKDVRVTRELFDQEDIPYIAVAEALILRHPESDYYFVHDGHLNPAGAAFVASVLRDYLVEQYFPRKQPR